jgi:hypothetical protein
MLLTLCIALPSLASRQANRLVAPPAGGTLPIVLVKTIKSGELKPGQPVIGRFLQRVPVGAGEYLPAKVEILGQIVSVTPSSLSLLFTQLRWKAQTLPIHVRLLAAASSQEVFQTKLPVGGTDRGTSSPADWTTRQVGGDEVYLSAGWGKVYNQYSEPVGYADLGGIYADPSSKTELPRAVGPFSITATGIHGMPDFSIVSPGTKQTPIILSVNKRNWKIDSGAALLLEVLS